MGGRTYDEKYEESDEKLVANKYVSCAARREAQILSKATIEIPKVSETSQRCFTELIFGKSPGSNVGSSTETSVDDCMSKCAASQDCLAVTFGLSDGLCNLLGRTYDEKYEESNDKVVANKYVSCAARRQAQILSKAAIEMPKVSKASQRCFTKV